MKAKLFDQVGHLNEHHIAVRKKWATVYKFQNADNWEYVSELDALVLKQQIAPLIMSEQDDSGSRMFDALMLNISLSKLETDVDASRSRKKVMDIAQRLQRKATIPAVQERMETIVEISSHTFWRDASLERLEEVRQELRDIIYVVLGTQHEKFFISISDVMEEKDGVEKPQMETDYHTRILDYLKEHRDYGAINKIYRLEQLTPYDIADLERICWQEQSQQYRDSC